MTSDKKYHGKQKWEYNGTDLNDAFITHTSVIHFIFLKNTVCWIFLCSVSILLLFDAYVYTNEIYIWHSEK